MLDLLGNVKGTYVMEAQTHREKEKKAAKSTRRSPVKIVLIAAVIASLLAGCTYAVMRLQDLKMGEYIVTHEAPIVSTDAASDEKQEETVVTEVRNVISLQGFVGSNGYQASKEWLDFKNSYDQNNELAIANDDFKAPRVYDGYGVYTQEMMDKVDEICQKYNLVPMGRSFTETTNVPAALKLLGVNDLLVSGAEAKLEHMQGYYYQEGTFNVEGDVTLTNVDTPLVETLFFGIRCAMKHALDVVPASMGDVEDYTQWNYTTKDGVELLLVTSKSGAIIIADRPECFIFMNFHRGYSEDNTLTQEQLEALADVFDFTILPHTVSVEDGIAREKKSDQEWEENQQKLAERAEAEYNELYRNASYSEFIQESLNDPKRKNAKFVLRDVTGDGEDDRLMLGEDYNQWNGTRPWLYVLNIQPDGKTELLFDGCFQLLEGDFFGPIIQGGDYPLYEYFRLTGTGIWYDKGRADYVSLRYSVEHDKWFKHCGEGEGKEVSESEAMEIINSYTPIELDWKPIIEFPMN